MKRLWAFAKRPASLPALCYTAIWLGWLLVCAFRLGSDGIARAGGSLREITLQPADMQWVALEPLADGALYTATDDPQLIWSNTQGIPLRSFRFAAEISDEGHEMCLYYTTPGNEDFSEHKRVWPVQQADGSYLFTLPRNRIEALRLDPVSIAGLTVDFKGIWLNEAQAPLSYFNPGAWGLAWLLAGPALLAAALSWLAGMVQHYILHKRKGQVPRSAR